MKAIILAGGAGTRLRPLSEMKPKPMLRLFDRPLLEHIVCQLRDQGFTQLCMTLHYLPEVIRSWFGDGRDLGVQLEYRLEYEAAGTAGSVRACWDFIGNDDFLVISGDAACAFDFRSMMEKHRISAADCTILVQERSSPLEFGLVLAEQDGRIRSFVEKPDPRQVCTSLINTGIYAFSPAVLSEIPERGSCDFGGDVFPRLLKARRRLLTWQPEGYWDDAGSCAAYRRITRDVLEGRFRLPTLPGKDELLPGPVWISPKAEVSEKASLGPYSVVGAGSTVAEGCRVTDSILNGAVLSPGCRVEASILDEGVFLGRESRVQDGCVIAQGASCGEGTLLRSGAMLWPGVSLPEHTVVSSGACCTSPPWKPRFREGAILWGEAARELTPELLLSMGRSAPASRLCAVSGGSPYADLLRDAFLLGAGAAGRECFAAAGEHAAAAAALGPICGLDLTLFLQQEGSRVTLRFFGPDGLPLRRKRLRAMESPVGEPPKALPAACRRQRAIAGTEELWLGDALRMAGDLSGLTVACEGEGLGKALRRAGACVAAPADGIAQLRLEDGGFALHAFDETGREFRHGLLLCAWAKLELAAGATALAVPYSAPALLERIAEEYNAAIYRLERDGAEARRVFRQLPVCRDGLTLALRLLSLLLASPFGSLGELMDALPPNAAAEKVLPIHRADTAILRQLALDEGAETVSGVRLRDGTGTATVQRISAGELRILAEGASMEAAEELALTLSRRIRLLDGEREQ